MYVVTYETLSSLSYAVQANVCNRCLCFILIKVHPSTPFFQEFLRGWISSCNDVGKPKFDITDTPTISFPARLDIIMVIITGSPSSLYEPHKRHNMASNYNGLYRIFYKISMEVPWSQRLSFILYSEILRRKPLLLFLLSAWIGESAESFQRSHRFMPITKIIKAVCVAKFRCKE